MPDSQDPNKIGRDYTQYAGMVIKMGVIIALGVWVGRWGDNKMGWTDPPVLTIIGSLIAVGTAIYVSIKDLIKP